MICKKYTRFVYPPPDLLARFCKVNLLNAKNSSRFVLLEFEFFSRPNVLWSRPILLFSITLWESVPGAKGCGQPIWLKLGTEVKCDEIFQNPLWLTFIGGSHFLLFEYQKSSLPGGILKVPENPTGIMCCQMNLTMNSTTTELLVHACNFFLMVLDKEKPWARVWPKVKITNQNCLFLKF